MKALKLIGRVAGVKLALQIVEGVYGKDAKIIDIIQKIK